LLASRGNKACRLKWGTGQKYTAKPPEKGRKAFANALKGIWELFDFQCGKLLAPLTAGMLAFLILEFNPSKELSGPLQPAGNSRKKKNGLPLEAFILPSRGPFEKPNPGTARGRAFSGLIR
jgi:hypothetical protein